MNFFGNNLEKIKEKFITITRGSAEIPKTREVLPPSNREIRELETEQEVGEDKSVKSSKIAFDHLICPYCASKEYIKRGWRTKKRERVQLMQCKACRKTFTPQSVKGKHYPLATIFDAIARYNLGYSLEESCRPRADIEKPTFERPQHNSAEETALSGTPRSDGGEGQGSAPTRVGNFGSGTVGASTLANWIDEFKERLPFLRMREFAISKYTPEQMVVTATLVHRQLYRFRYHRAKCDLIMQESFKAKAYKPLAEFLELVPSECPHQYFSAEKKDGGIMRASESKIKFSKEAMIVRGKQNYATMMAEFVLQSVKDRRARHDALQKYFLYNDSVTIATEVPVYLTKDDLEHLQTMLGFEVHPSADIEKAELSYVPNGTVPSALETDGSAPTRAGNLGSGVSKSALGLPDLITGHIDFLQIRNGMIHILDYKPNAEKERPIEQLTLYAMALSRLTGLRIFEFKCAWFDEKDYFEFYPLHVLHKPKKARRRKKVETQEGTYLVNKESKKINSVRPI